PPDLQLLLDLRADGAALAALEPQYAREKRARLALEPRIAIGKLEPRCRQRLHLAAIERGHRALHDARADVLAVASGVAIDGPSHGAGDAGRVGEPGQSPLGATLDEREVVGAAADARRGALEVRVLDGILHHEAAVALV